MQKSVKESLDRIFITSYIEKFNKFISNLPIESRDIVRKNKNIDAMYDLVLDFILDASQHLDYIDAKEREEL
jgi:hypothetical protein